MSVQVQENIEVEQSFLSEVNRIKVFSVAPGVIDTEMQNQIRETSPEDFSNVEKFITLKENNELVSPKETADLLLKIIDNRDNYSNVVLDVREL